MLRLFVFLMAYMVGFVTCGAQTPEAFPLIGLPTVLISGSADGHRIVVYNVNRPTASSDLGFIGLLSNSSIRHEVALTQDQENQFKEFNTKLQDGLDSQFGVFQRDEMTDEFRAEIKKVVSQMQIEALAKVEEVLLPHQLSRLKLRWVRNKGGKTKFIEQLRSSDIAEQIDLTNTQDGELVKKHEVLTKELNDKMERLKLEYRNQLITILKEEQQEQLRKIFGIEFFKGEDDD